MRAHRLVGLAALLAVVPPARAQPPVDSARVAAATPPRRWPSRPPPARPAPDPWLGADKLRHFVLAGLVQGTGFGVATAAGVDGRPALVAASVATAVVSLGKEVHDRRRGGRFSARDLAWDALGGALWGVLVARSGR